ncbi:MAG: S16 family serine protease, partial [Thermodesulfobacteriota bacterium]|nr:S16 family serine protease [Thermodesulfobacteriota bacterium]
IEATTMPGKGNLTLTGQLGEVMKESAQAALSFARSRAKKLKLANDFYENVDIHIHVPAGAIPKDGPSAGVTMAAALISNLTGRTVARNLAMTGEITLRGKILPIGGLKEKTLAALRAGIHKIIIPEQNRKDLSEIPPKVRKRVQFLPVENMDQFLDLVFPGPDAKTKPQEAKKPKRQTKREARAVAKQPERIIPKNT